jgi:hypothetical protein
MVLAAMLVAAVPGAQPLTAEAPARCRNSGSLQKVTVQGRVQGDRGDYEGKSAGAADEDYVFKGAFA